MRGRIRDKVEGGVGICSKLPEIPITPHHQFRIRVALVRTLALRGLSGQDWPTDYPAGDFRHLVRSRLDSPHLGHGLAEDPGSESTFKMLIAEMQAGEVRSGSMGWQFGKFQRIPAVVTLPSFPNVFA